MIDFKLKNKWDIPSQSLPIIFIGAGGIIRNAHIPAYKKLNLNIAGVYDLNPETAKTLAKDFNIPDVYNNLEDALKKADNEIPLLITGSLYLAGHALKFNETIID